MTDPTPEDIENLIALFNQSDWQEWLEEEGEPWWHAFFAGSILSLLFFVASLLVIAAWWRARRRTRVTYDSLPE